jgi:hypothetical protein
MLQGKENKRPAYSTITSKKRTILDRTIVKLEGLVRCRLLLVCSNCSSFLAALFCAFLIFLSSPESSANSLLSCIFLDDQPTCNTFIGQFNHLQALLYQYQRFLADSNACSRLGFSFSRYYIQ